MSAQQVDANGIRIAYEEFGDPSHQPLVLVMGLGTQMLGWPEAFCEQLAAHELRVIRFDNRDIGLSTHLHGTAVPGPVKTFLRRAEPPYTVDDMADDLHGLLDALELESVDLVGASLGGFIAQSLAIRYPSRVRSLALIMTSTGSRRVGTTAPRILPAILRKRDIRDREGAVQAALETQRLIGSPGYPVDEARIRVAIELGYDRSFDPDGVRRQLSAVTAQRDRTAGLRTLTIPTTVMHGFPDPLVAVSGGLALARTIPAAKFVGFSGMGHDLPEALWPDFIHEIIQLTHRNRGLRVDPAADNAVATDVLGV